MKKIIFHIPNRVDEKLASGSQIRPMRMLQAFEDIGYEVHRVMGGVKERRQQIKKIKRNIEKGVEYEFLYSESSTMPTALTEKHHLPIAPFLDFNFFRFCKKKNIKIGLFYRDIHWKFDQYRVSKFKSKVALIFYKFDLSQYEKLLDVLYLPSVEMLDFVPINFNNKIKALPPAVSELVPSIPCLLSNRLSFVYVGGVGKLYDLKMFIDVVNKNKYAFNISTRKQEWDTMKNTYEKIIGNSIQVFHLSGEKLESIYFNSKIGVLFVKPTKYWKFVMAVKLFEYLAYKKPIIAVKGTAVGNFVEKNNIGWTIEYTEKALEKTLTELKNNPQIIQEKIENIEKIIPQNTWEARAIQVKKDLS